MAAQPVPGLVGRGIRPPERVMNPATKAAYQLMHDGALALARMEHNGIRVDEEYLRRTDADIDRKCDELIERMRGDKIWKIWKKVHGEVKIGNRTHLANILFDYLEHPYKADLTATLRYRADKEVLSGVDEPFVADFLRYHKLKKLQSTYVRGIYRELVTGRVHPFFNLNTVITYRSSSDRPNFQNVPVRDKEIADMIRRAYLADDGWRLLEVDFSGIEVKVAACYNHDPNLVRYIEDPTTDMHRDTAAELFLLPVVELVRHKDWAKKTVRDWAKNRFVFPSFYGSVWFQCAPHLWEAVRAVNPEVPWLGIRLLDHLKSKGIRRACACKIEKDRKGKVIHKDPKDGTFCAHVREVERSFWEDRFSVYSQWKDEWYAEYRAQAGFRMHTGFVCEGLFGRNDVINYPVQGTAFHCLLWSIVRLQREIDRRKMRTKLIGQIHDSVIATSPPDEIQEFLGLAHEVMTKKLPSAWDWICVPLEVEAEVTPAGGNWNEKQQWVQNGSGAWAEKKKTA